MSESNYSNILEEITILYVEDDTETAKHVSETLLLFSKNILIASNTEEAYEFFINNDIHLLITDIEMPGKNGISLIKKIRERNISIPIIVITAFTNNEYLIDCLNLNIHGYIQKPISYNKLTEIIRKTVEYLNISNNIHFKIAEDIYYNQLESSIIKNKEFIKLHKKEKYLMDLLVKNKNKLVTYETFEQIIWTNFDESMSQCALRTLIKSLRQKLSNKFIENVSGIGYKLNTSLD